MMQENKSTKRNREWREQQAKGGKSEIRGVYAVTTYHERIKARVKKYIAHLDNLTNIDDNEL